MFLQKLKIIGRFKMDINLNVVGKLQTHGLAVKGLHIGKKCTL